MKPRVAHLLNGAATIADLFGAAFRVAAHGLGSADVAALLRTRVGDVRSLGWLDASSFTAVTAHVDSLALRKTDRRLTLSKTERRQLVRLLGGDEALADPRRLFILAYALDARYADVSPRTAGGSARITEVPAQFLGDIDNPPPPIGQMTPIAACRRWMRAFWYQGNPKGFDGFGSLPEPVMRGLPSATAQTLQRAVEDEELRFGLVSWGPHAASEIRRYPAAASCFAVEGFGPPATEERLRRLLDQLHAARVHIAVLPELAISPTEADALAALLAANGRRYPALVVVSTTHRTRQSGGYVNEAMVFAANGQEVLRHEKIEPYSFRDEHGAWVLEDVVPRGSEAYELLDTPVGRVVVNICRDVRSDAPMVLNRMLGVSVLLVPAYSGKLTFVQEEATLLGARQGALVAAVNPPAAHLNHSSAFYAPILSLTKAAQLVPGAAVPPENDLLQVFRVRRRSAVGEVISDAPTSL